MMHSEFIKSLQSAASTDQLDKLKELIEKRLLGQIGPPPVPQRNESWEDILLDCFLPVSPSADFNELGIFLGALGSIVSEDGTSNTLIERAFVVFNRTFDWLKDDHQYNPVIISLRTIASSCKLSDLQEDSASWQNSALTLLAKIDVRASSADRSSEWQHRLQSYLKNLESNFELYIDAVDVCFAVLRQFHEAASTQAADRYPWHHLPSLFEAMLKHDLAKHSSYFRRWIIQEMAFRQIEAESSKRQAEFLKYVPEKLGMLSYEVLKKINIDVFLSDIVEVLKKRREPGEWPAWNVGTGLLDAFFVRLGEISAEISRPARTVNQRLNRLELTDRAMPFGATTPLFRPNLANREHVPGPARIDSLHSVANERLCA